MSHKFVCQHSLDYSWLSCRFKTDGAEKSSSVPLFNQTVSSIFSVSLTPERFRNRGDLNPSVIRFRHLISANERHPGLVLAFGDLYAAADEKQIFSIKVDSCRLHSIRSLPLFFQRWWIRRRVPEAIPRVSQHRLPSHTKKQHHTASCSPRVVVGNFVKYSTPYSFMLTKRIYFCRSPSGR